MLCQYYHSNNTRNRSKAAYHFVEIFAPFYRIAEGSRLTIVIGAVGRNDCIYVRHYACCDKHGRNLQFWSAGHAPLYIIFAVDLRTVRTEKFLESPQERLEVIKNGSVLCTTIKLRFMLCSVYE